MKKILHIIAEAPLFNGLAEDQLNQVRQIAVDKFYDKGKTVFLEGDDCNGFYIVADGKVKSKTVGVKNPETFQEFMIKRIERKLPTKKKTRYENIWDKITGTFKRTFGWIWDISSKTISTTKGFFGL